MTPGTFGNETLQKTGLRPESGRLFVLFCLLPGSSLQRTDNYRDLKMCALCLLQLL